MIKLKKIKNQINHLILKKIIKHALNFMTPQISTWCASHGQKVVNREKNNEISIIGLGRSSCTQQCWKCEDNVKTLLSNFPWLWSERGRQLNVQHMILRSSSQIMTFVPLPSTFFLSFIWFVARHVVDVFFPKFK